MGYKYAAILILTLLATSTQAGRHQEEVSSSTPDVMVEMPAEVWSQGQNRQVNCPRCCIYENRSYTEGAVVRAEGVLLQCARDEQSLGTNNLIWKIVR
ncbi:YnjH family protein [[Erwinia] mediterraneensis]|uniref:YnjH family protein n=1 Tax=[Erwinia] mediterraneensis TaxID=2161819 RepID=UPI00102FEED6|nr:YnjH family protein [[Erwinia] mediterraneensis]